MINHATLVFIKDGARESDFMLDVFYFIYGESAKYRYATARLLLSCQAFSMVVPVCHGLYQNDCTARHVAAQITRNPLSDACFWASSGSPAPPL